MSKVVFRKTAQGTAEMTTRTGAFTPRVRRILILVDGKRTVDQVRELASADDLTHSLSLLEESGMIEVLSAPNVNRLATAANAPLPPVHAFRDNPPPHDPLRVQLARNFMINTIRAFLGTVGTSAMLMRLEEATSLETLRDCFGEWYYLITTSRDGRREAEALREKLLETI
ncbi:MAG: hypothetical protein K2W33_18840 [Burkholderiales bacterium]|nr:hypothetical protein [Burkholderiales bacterium]